MYCQKCGKKMLDDAKFCNDCGQPLEILVRDENQYGGFWIRFSAYVIDCVILLIPTLLVSFLLRATNPADDYVIFFIDSIMNFSIFWIYQAALESSVWQATLGKRLLGLKVVDYEGKRISFGKATGRYFASFLSAILLFIGFIMIAFTKKKQGLHDMMAGTLILRGAQI